jgi:hypothetical protein
VAVWNWKVSARGSYAARRLDLRFATLRYLADESMLREGAVKLGALFEAQRNATLFR